VRIPDREIVALSRAGEKVFSCPVRIAFLIPTCGYEEPQMILSVYATLGVFLLVASRNPLANLSLIWFTVWSSVVHAGVIGTPGAGEP
jgi:hypothetical protein